MTALSARHETKQTLPPASRAPAGCFDFFGDGSFLMDPRVIGSPGFAWPNRCDLPHVLSKKLSHALYDLIADPDLAPQNQCLRALFRLPGALAYTLSFIRLRQAAEAQGLPGFYVAPEKTGAALSATKEARKKPALRHYLFFYGQAALFRILKLAGVHPRLTSNTDLPYPPARFGTIHRLRSLDTARHIARPRRLADADRARLDAIATRLLAAVERVAAEEDIHLSPAWTAHIRAQIASDLAETFSILKSFEVLLGGLRFDLFERSLSSHDPALLSILCRRAGGTAHSTCHGGEYHTADEPDNVTVMNASIFWGTTAGIAADVRELSQAVPASLRTAEIRDLALDPAPRYRQDFPATPRAIKSVAIMGRQVLMQTSAFNMYEQITYLDLEKKLSALLLDLGYQVIYKGHPESTWRHFETLFDPRVRVEWRYFEEVKDDFQALFFHSGTTTALTYGLGRPYHIFMLEDGFHDVALWSRRCSAVLHRYCNMIPARINAANLYELDPTRVRDSLARPKTPDPQRLDDFFHAEASGR